MLQVREYDRFDNGQSDVLSNSHAIGRKRVARCTVPLLLFVPLLLVVFRPVEEKVLRENGVQILRQ